MSSIWNIRRSTDDAKLAGVCGGVARHWNVDPVLVRVGWVLLALSGGIGLVLYVAGWLLIPMDGKDKPVAFDLLGEPATRFSREVWIAIVIAACALSVMAFDAISPFGFGPALILALIWYFGYYRTKVGRASSPPPARRPPADTMPAVPPAAPSQFYSHPGPPTAFTQAADAWRERVMEVQRDKDPDRFHNPATTTPPAREAARTGAEQAGARGTWPPEMPEDRSEPTGWAQPPDVSDHQAFLAHPDPAGLYSPQPVPTPVVVKPADRPSARRLRLVGLSVLGLTLAGLAIADSAGAHLPVAAYLAASLLVIGLVLVAATLFGRARGILPIGIIVALITAAATAAPQIPTPTELQPQRLAYTSVSEFPAGGVQFDVGSAEIDLSRLVLTEDATYTAAVDLGSLRVTAPPGVNVVVDYSVDAGSVNVFGKQQASGTELQSVLATEPVDAAKPTLTLNLTADVGQIEVNR